MDVQSRRDGQSTSREAKQQAHKQTASGTLPSWEINVMHRMSIYPHLRMLGFVFPWSGGAVGVVMLPGAISTLGVQYTCPVLWTAPFSRARGLAKSVERGMHTGAGCLSVSSHAWRVLANDGSGQHLVHATEDQRSNTPLRFPHSTFKQHCLPTDKFFNEDNTSPQATSGDQLVCARFKHTRRR